ncbi:MAG: hypothetical protein NTZ44_00970 [Candidatus Nomurabacteria bacterium]|nr:hypothetical protein [Candidatus Nomurabacteria bacterium]
MKKFRKLKKIIVKVMTVIALLLGIGGGILLGLFFASLAGCIKPPKMIDSIQNEEWKIVKKDTAFQIIQIERIILPDSIKTFRYKNPKTRVVYIRDKKNPTLGFNRYSREVQTFNTIGLNDKTIKGIHFIDLSKAHQIPNKEFICKNKNKLHILCRFDKEYGCFIFTEKIMDKGDPEWVQDFNTHKLLLGFLTVVFAIIIFKLLQMD